MLSSEKSAAVSMTMMVKLRVRNKIKGKGNYESGQWKENTEL